MDYFQTFITQWQRHKLDDDGEVDLAYTIERIGRFRANLDSRLRKEIVKDLFWELKLYATYDSDPPDGSFSTTDYGVVLSLGYSF